MKKITPKYAVGDDVEVVSIPMGCNPNTKHLIGYRGKIKSIHFDKLGTKRHTYRLEREGRYATLYYWDDNLTLINH